MISKPLFKQSCKAHGSMWIVITLAVCFMLSCVMLIGGSGGIAKTKMAVQSSIIEGELTAQMEKRSLNYYDTTSTALDHFDGKFKEEFVLKYMEYIAQSYPEEQAKALASIDAYTAALTDLNYVYIPALAASLGYEPTSKEYQELQGLIMYVLNPMTQTGYMFDDFYIALGEDAPRYDMQSVNDDNRKEYREVYCQDNASIFLAGNMVKEENIELVLKALESFGVTKEDYHKFGFDSYPHVKEIAETVVVNFRANLQYRLENMKPGETEAFIKQELTEKFTSSLLSSLPKEISSALADIGEMDLYGLLVGSIFFKMAGLLLPIIYLIMTANALIAGQVDSGSMAYILSTSTKRKTVARTQALFLVLSLFVMFALTSITSVVCLSIVNIKTNLTIGKVLLINLGAFIVMFAMSGICFLASSVFNRSKHSMALGGGLSMFFLVATMLGLFGSQIIPQIIRMDALNFFNYVSIISLFDVLSILNGSLTFLWKLGILLAIGCGCYIFAFNKFEKKDLPL